MMFLKFFKRKKKAGPACRHYKKSFEPHPENMVSVIKFTDGQETTFMPFGIYECTECGHRAFSCLYLHCMSSRAQATIDSFIKHEITLDALKTHFNEFGFTYRD